MFYKIILLCTIVLPFNYCFQFHDDLTDDEVFSTFKVFRNFVPEYDVVPISHTLHKRDAQPKVKLSAFNQDFNLYLEPNSNLLAGTNTPVYLAYKDSSKNTGVRYVKFNHDLDVKVFHDIDNEAAIMISENAKKQVEIHGTIGNNYVIRPIPLNIQKKLKNGNHSEAHQHNEYYTTHHIVMKVPERENHDEYKGIEVMNKTFGKTKLRFRRNVVDNVYPEILVTSDYETFVAHGKNIEEQIKYTVVFWNGVDLRYRSVKLPKIHLNIAGIVIAMESGAAPYLELRRLDQNLLWDSETMFEISSFFYIEKQIPQNTYDIVFAMTKLDLIRMSDTTNDIVNTTRAISFYAGACRRSMYRSLLFSAALTEDNTKFNGINGAAHEIAHLLGASHDGEVGNNDIPGGESCLFSDGYIMSYIKIKENSFKWSACTLESFKYLLSKPQTRCLRNKPNIKQPYPKVLPGSIVSLEDQCNAIIPGSKPCSTNESICRELFCHIPGITKCVSYQGAVEGSPCANSEGICLIGKCVIPPKELGII